MLLYTCTLVDESVLPAWLKEGRRQMRKQLERLDVTKGSIPWGKAGTSDGLDKGGVEILQSLFRQGVAYYHANLSAEIKDIIIEVRIP